MARATFWAETAFDSAAFGATFPFPPFTRAAAVFFPPSFARGFSPFWGAMVTFFFSLAGVALGFSALEGLGFAMADLGFSALGALAVSFGLAGAALATFSALGCLALATAFGFSALAATLGFSAFGFSAFGFT